jgi:hypothetical protein
MSFLASFGSRQTPTSNLYIDDDVENEKEGGGAFSKRKTLFLSTRGGNVPSRSAASNVHRASSRSLEESSVCRSLCSTRKQYEGKERQGPVSANKTQSILKSGHGLELPTKRARRVASQSLLTYT